MKRCLFALLVLAGFMFAQPQVSTVFQTLCTNSTGCAFSPIRNIGQAYHLFSITWKDDGVNVCSTVAKALPVGSDISIQLTGSAGAVDIPIPVEFVAHYSANVATNRANKIYKAAGAFPRLGFIASGWHTNCLVDVNYTGSISTMPLSLPPLTTTMTALVFGAQTVIPVQPFSRWAVYGWSFTCNGAVTVQIWDSEARVGGSGVYLLSVTTPAAGIAIVVPVGLYPQWRSQWMGASEIKADAGAGAACLLLLQWRQE